MSTSKNGTKQPSKKVTLLLVDDKLSNLVALEAVLADPEYHLISVTSGRDALVALEEHHVSLILLDVQMPDMDGYETAKRIKTVEKNRDIPIIFVTAIYREDPFIRKGFEVGAVDYFSKPFDPEILKLKVALYSSFRHKTLLLEEREYRLKETEELLIAGKKLSAVLEELPVGVLISDSNGRICQVNEEVARIWEFEATLEADSYGELIGWWGKEGKLVRDKDSPIARCLKGGIALDNEFTLIKCRSGREKTVLNSVSPLRNIEGHIVGAVAVIQDITQHKEIEHDLEVRIQKLISVGIEIQQSTHQM
ncbi:MAG: response regulator [Oligoflexales bacterium]